VLYRKSGQTGFIVADQRSTGGGTSSIDDLTPAVSYEIGVQAFSAFGIGSAVVTGATQLAPTRTTAPTAPSGGTISADGITPALFSGAYLFGTVIKWDANTDVDFDHYELKVTATDSDAATDYNYGANGTADLEYLVEPRAMVYSVLAPLGYVRVQSVNRSGVASAWVRFGSTFGLINTGLNFGTTTGSIAQGNDSRITGSAQKASNLSDVASPSTARANLGINRFSHVETFTSVGAASTTFTFTHSLGTVQNFVLAQCVDPANNLLIAHDYPAAGNTSNATVFKVETVDGSNISDGGRRFTIHFVQ